MSSLKRNQLSVFLISALMAFLLSGHAFASKEEVKIGVLAKRGAEQCLTMWSPTAKYLSAAIPEKTFKIIPVDFDQIYRVVKHGEVDFILANPSFYVELEAWFGANRIATLKNLRNGGVYTKFAGVIFSRADRRDIQSFSDLKGKRFMAVKETSLGGWRMAWREFVLREIDPYKDFSELRFGGTHDAVVYAVQNGIVDAGTVRSDTLERMEAEGKIRHQDFYVIPHHEVRDSGAVAPHNHKYYDVPFAHSTVAYPEWPMAKVQHTSDRLAEKVGQALLEMSPDTEAAVAAKCAGWTIPLNYQSVHDLLRDLKLGPYKELGKITFTDVIAEYKYWFLIAMVLFAGMFGATLVISRLNKNLRLAYVKLEEEIDEHKKTANALRESEHFAETIVSSVGEGVIVYDPDLRYRGWNKYMEKLTGLTSNKVIGRKAMDVFPHIKGQGVDQLLMKALDGEVVRSGDIPYIVPATGNEGWVVGVYSPHYDPMGNIIGIVATVRDVTQSKQAEKALIDSHERFKAVMDSLDAMVYVSDLDTYELLFINKYGRQVWGENTLGKTCWEVLQKGQSGPCKFCTNDKLVDFAGNPSGTYVWEFQNTVNKRWYQCRDEAIRWTDGRIVRMEIATDITNRKGIEEELRQKNNFLNNVLESLTHPFCVIDPNDYTIKIANKAITGGTLNPGDTCHKLTHHSSTPCESSAHPCPIQIIKKERKPVILEHIHYDQKGELRNVEVHAYPVFDDAGHISEVIEYSLDVTDRKRAEEAVKEHEEYLRTVMGAIQAGVVVSDANTHRIHDVNPFAEKMIGIKKNNIVGTKWSDYITLNGHGDEPSKHMDGIGEDGELKPANDAAISVRVSQANASIKGISYMVQSFLDVSDMKQLLSEQSVNIDLAKKLLDVINSELPRYTPFNVDLNLFVDTFSIPCKAAGGDHYFIHTIKNGKPGTDKTVASVKDQSGHEVNCILRSIVTDLIHNSILYSQPGDGVANVTTELNGILHWTGLFGEDDFLTGINLEIDHATHLMRFVSCGHPPLLVIRGTEVIPLPQTNGFGQNLPMGTIENAEFSEGSFQLLQGDKLIIYTDGLLALPKAKEKEEISSDDLHHMLEKLVKSDPEARVSHLMDSLLTNLSGLTPGALMDYLKNAASDDVTVVCMELEPPVQGSEEILHCPSLDTLLNQGRALDKRIRHDWEKRGFDNADNRLLVVLQEALLNAWTHGHGNNPDLPITVRWKDANDFHLEVIDQGVGFDIEKIPDPTAFMNLLNETGRGIAMIKIYSDFTRWQNGGKHLSVSFRKSQYLSKSNQNSYTQPATFSLWDSRN